MATDLLWQQPDGQRLAVKSLVVQAGPTHRQRHIDERLALAPVGICGALALGLGDSGAPAVKLLQCSVSRPFVQCALWSAVCAGSGVQWLVGW